MKDITPLDLRCSIGACPAVFEQENGKIIIIAKKLPAELLALIRHRIGEDEDAVVIDPAYLKGAPIS